MEGATDSVHSLGSTNESDVTDITTVAADNTDDGPVGVDNTNVTAKQAPSVLCRKLRQAWKVIADLQKQLDSEEGVHLTAHATARMQLASEQAAHAAARTQLASEQAAHAFARTQLASAQAARATLQKQLESEQAAHQTLQKRYAWQFILVSRGNEVEVRVGAPRFNRSLAYSLTPMGCVWNMCLRGGLRCVNFKLGFASRVTSGSTMLT